VAIGSPITIAPVVSPSVAPRTAQPRGADWAAARAGYARAASEAGHVREVAAQRTPMSMGRIQTALANAYRRDHGETMPPAMLRVLTAHVAHETGRGDKMFNFNFGGIKGAGPSGLSARYTTTEVLGGETKKIVDGFRAYRGVEEGARDYLQLLGQRFPQALKQAEGGDVAAFAGALKRSGYFTADLAGYTAALQAHVHSAARGGHEGSRYLYGTELAAEGRRIDGVADAELPTSIEVARVLGAMSSLAARIGTPIEQDAEKSELPRAGERG
jgi:hypothetical protein